MRLLPGYEQFPSACQKRNQPWNIASDDGASSLCQFPESGSRLPAHPVSQVLQGRQRGCWGHMKIRPCLAHRSTWFPLFLQSSGILGAFFLEQETYSCRRVVSWEGKRSWIRVRVPQLHAWCGQCYGQVQSGDFHLSVRPGLGDAVYYVQDSKAHSSQNMTSVSSLPPTPN